MKERIFDKVIILILQIFIVIILEISDSNIFVVDILITSSILMITEIYRNNTVAVVAAVFSVLATFVTSSLYLIFPIVIYCLYSTSYVSESVNAIIDRIDSRNKLLPLIINSVMAVIVLFYAAYNVINVAISLIALIVSINTDRKRVRFERLEASYDKSRDSLYLIKRKNEEAIHQADENIYMATLEERNRIAREIHDNVGHILTRSIVQMQAVKVVNKDEEVAPLLESVDESINQAMLNIRKSVHELHDDSIDISIMTNELLKTLPDRFQVSCKTSIESAMSSELKNSILAILKECITNIAKYSKGEKVRVEIIEHTAFWRLSVQDNGENVNREYDTSFRDLDNEGGIGLINIYTRAKKLGGRANITSNEDGFTVLVTVPK